MLGAPYQEDFEKLSKYVYQTQTEDPLLTSEVLGQYEALEDLIRKIEGKPELNAEEEYARIIALYRTIASLEDRMPKYYKKYPELEGLVGPVGPGKLRK